DLRAVRLEPLEDVGVDRLLLGRAVALVVHAVVDEEERVLRHLALLGRSVLRRSSPPLCGVASRPRCTRQRTRSVGAKPFPRSVLRQWLRRTASPAFDRVTRRTTPGASS